MPFDEEQYLRFCEFFYTRTGIQFGAGKRYFVDRRLAERVAATGQPTLRAYMLKLRYEDRDGEEMQLLINEMTVNETYFYREDYQLRALASEMMPELAARRRGETLRIWSLPCSTGEEPYSIALHLTENWPGLETVDVEIVASDIDTRALSRARAGVYGERALHNLPPEMRARYFESAGPERWRIAAPIRGAVRFTATNLSDPAEMARHRGLYDVIFCRNLLIYFDDASRRQAGTALYEALRPGGFVCLGHSEAMSRICSLFTVRKFRDAIVYQRAPA
ncbi:protein-glutamate O-methyltransferase CheR [Roseomonas sp. PWR1]|uniref:protein-glutamate O-methyltransferase n=2 Tax=Roseomonas nitratireducens TaxID=2820810 RepID=A0ABS4AT04_9PROT|nr:protein-glutamate O-methyltransferase CheR [Neoroseomonas nitratireducens]